MSLHKLRSYIASNDTHDADYIEKMGFGEIAKLVKDGAMNKTLLLRLIDLSSNEAEKNEKDETAGHMIFDQCCNDKGMKERVNNFYKGTK